MQTKKPNKKVNEDSKPTIPSTRTLITQNQKQKLAGIAEFDFIFGEQSLEKLAIIPALLNSSEIHQKIEFFYEFAWKNLLKLLADDKFSFPKMLTFLANSESKDQLKSICDLLYSIQKSTPNAETKTFLMFVKSEFDDFVFLKHIYIRSEILSVLCINQMNPQYQKGISLKYVDMINVLTHAFSFDNKSSEAYKTYVKSTIGKIEKINAIDFLYHLAIAPIEIDFQKLVDWIGNSGHLKNFEIKKYKKDLKSRKKFVIKNFDLEVEEKQKEDDQEVDKMMNDILKSAKNGADFLPEKKLIKNTSKDKILSKNNVKNISSEQNLKSKTGLIHQNPTKTNKKVEVQTISRQITEIEEQQKIIDQNKKVKPKVALKSADSLKQIPRSESGKPKDGVFKKKPINVESDYELAYRVLKIPKINQKDIVFKPKKKKDEIEEFIQTEQINQQKVITSPEKEKSHLKINHSKSKSQEKNFDNDKNNDKKFYPNEQLTVEVNIGDKLPLEKYKKTHSREESPLITEKTRLVSGKVEYFLAYNEHHYSKFLESPILQRRREDNLWMTEGFKRASEKIKDEYDRNENSTERNASRKSNKGDPIKDDQELEQIIIKSIEKKRSSFHNTSHSPKDGFDDNRQSFVTFRNTLDESEMAKAKERKDRRESKNSEKIQNLKDDFGKKGFQKNLQDSSIVSSNPQKSDLQSNLNKNEQNLIGNQIYQKRENFDEKNDKNINFQQKNGLIEKNEVGAKKENIIDKKTENTQNVQEKTSNTNGLISNNYHEEDMDEFLQGESVESFSSSQNRITFGQNETIKLSIGEENIVLESEIVSREKHDTKDSEREKLESLRKDMYTFVEDEEIPELKRASMTFGNYAEDINTFVEETLEPMPGITPQFKKKENQKIKYDTHNNDLGGILLSIDNWSARKESDLGVNPRSLLIEPSRNSEFKTQELNQDKNSHFRSIDFAADIIKSYINETADWVISEMMPKILIEDASENEEIGKKEGLTEYKNSQIPINYSLDFSVEPSRYSRGFESVVLAKQIQQNVNERLSEN